jgi:riboflavin transporter FmnP
MLTMKKEKMTTRTLVKIGVLGAIAFILMALDFPLWFAPGFIKFDLSEVPALIGAFALGPVAGVLIELVKNILNATIKGSSTMLVGELSNFVLGCLFVIPASIIYHRDKTFKNAVKGLIAGLITMTLGAALSNYYIMIPFYAKVFGMPIEKIVAMGSAVNKMVVDFKTLILYAIIPFNLFKGTIVTIVTVLLYKKVSPILHR